MSLIFHQTLKLHLTKQNKQTNQSQSIQNTHTNNLQDRNIMEEPLTAREFLQRFHLPQLVRIDNLSIESARDEQDTTATSCDEPPPSRHQRHNNSHSKQFAQRTHSPTNSSTSISSSFVALNEALPDARDDFRSLAAQPTPDFVAKSRQTKPTIGQQQNSASLDRRQVRFRAQLRRVETNNSATDKQQTIGKKNGSQTITKGDEIVTSASNKKTGASVGGVESFECLLGSSSKRLLESVRLCPPCSEPALSKLDLKQPFLLFKAHSKLDVCAFVVDANNELCARSGFPIYLPQRYKGKCVVFN